MKLGKSRIFLLFCLSFIVGVGLGNYLNYYVMAIAAMIFVVMVTIRPHLNLLSSSGEEGKRGRGILLVGFLGLTLLLGAWRYKTSFPYNEPNFVGQYYGREIELEAVVVREPDVRSERVNLTVRPLSNSPLARGEGLEGNILLNLGRYPEYQYGDKLKIKGKLEEPFESEEFSYKNYLSRFDTYAVMRYPRVERIGSDEGNTVKSALLAVKSAFQTVLSKVMPEPHSALLLGIILGLKRALPSSLQEALVITGVSHIVVVSGFNISLITKGLVKTRWIWGRRIAFVLSILTILGFVVITGAEASVIRAGIMGLTLVLAMNIGRLYLAKNALILAAAMMIAQNPRILNFDIGFQLSFAATLGLIYLSPILEKWFKPIPDFYFLSLRANLSATLAAIVFTLPLLVYYFDRISLIAPLVNVIILWTVPYNMGLGIFAGIFGLLFFPAGKLAAALVWVLLEYDIRVIEFFSRVPLADAAARINIPIAIVYYLLLIFGIRFYRKRKGFYHELEYVEHRV